MVPDMDDLSALGQCLSAQGQLTDAQRGVGVNGSAGGEWVAAMHRRMDAALLMTC